MIGSPSSRFDLKLCRLGSGLPLLRPYSERLSPPSQWIAGVYSCKDLVVKTFFADPKVRLHDLRHGHATHLLAQGIHSKVVSERLGHSTIGITLTYSHVMPGMQEEAAQSSTTRFAPRLTVEAAARDFIAER